MFENKKICVLGGTGSIGSVVVEYLMEQNPKVIRVLCNSEKELWKKEQKWGKPNLRYLLGDVRDKERIKRALVGIDYAFNFAAVKHVPKAEYNPMEAVYTNIVGLSNIIDGCVDNGVKKLFHMSTDKACEPTTLMGMTKGVGERLLQIRWTQHEHVDMVCVRSGNVWDTSGSLMELVEEHLKQDSPIPITDFRMKRYFIEQKDLLEFIMKAFKEGKHGEIWVPKLEELSIKDIIRGKAGKDYPVVEVGRRRGEKLREKLVSEAEDYEDKGDYYVIRGGVYDGL